MKKSWQAVVDILDEGKRIDSFVSLRCPNFVRSLATDENTLFFIDNKPVKKGRKLKEGETVTVQWQESPQFSDLEAQDISLNILYEDKEILVINKQQSLVVHPGAGNLDNTLVNALIYRYGENFFNLEEESVRPGIVHRLDKETSGVMVVALNREAHNNLSLQFQNRSVVKTYIALVHGVVDKRMMRIETPLIRDPKDRRRFTVSKIDKGKSALTEYRLLRQIGSFGLLRVTILTGRTHQIRVHLSSIGLPIVGDSVYGRNSDYPMMLHAFSLKIKHPKSDKELTFRAPLPLRFKELIRQYSDD